MYTVRGRELLVGCGGRLGNLKRVMTSRLLSFVLYTSISRSTVKKRLHPMSEYWKRLRTATSTA